MISLSCFPLLHFLGFSSGRAVITIKISSNPFHSHDEHSISNVFFSFSPRGNKENLYE
jgi:hypothetical protein